MVAAVELRPGRPVATSSRSPLYDTPPNYDDPQQPATTPVQSPVVPFTLPTPTQQYAPAALPKPAGQPQVHPLVQALASAYLTRPGQQRFAQAAFPQRNRIDPIQILLQALRGAH